MKKLAILAILFSFALAFAEDKPSPVDEATQNKILKLQHVKDQAESKMAGIQTQWSQIQTQARELQDQAKAAQQQIADAQKAYDAEVDAAYKSAKLDKDKYSFDAEKMVFSPKPSPAPPTPSPEKK